MERIRIHYAKSEALRYTGTLEVHKIWERTLRRAALPLAYSQGFHPQPRLNQALPLPLGMTSRCELIDIWLEDDWTLDQVMEALNSARQPGLDIQSLELIELHAPSLPTLVQSACYEITLLDPVDLEDLKRKLADLLAATALPRVWKGKNYDLRPLIESAELHPSGQILLVQLSAREGATGRPEEVVAALGMDPFSSRSIRTQLILKTD